MSKCSLTIDGGAIAVRAPYDAGFVAELKTRSPLRCGLIMATGIESMGLFNVTKIHAWEDVRDSLGRVLVVSWGKGDDHFTEVWA